MCVVTCRNRDAREEDDDAEEEEDNRGDVVDDTPPLVRGNLEDAVGLNGVGANTSGSNLALNDFLDVFSIMGVSFLGFFATIVSARCESSSCFFFNSKALFVSEMRPAGVRDPLDDCDDATAMDLAAFLGEGEGLMTLRIDLRVARAVSAVSRAAGVR